MAGSVCVTVHETWPSLVEMWGRGTGGCGCGSPRARREILQGEGTVTMGSTESPVDGTVPDSHNLVIDLDDHPHGREQSHHHQRHAKPPLTNVAG